MQQAAQQAAEQGRDVYYGVGISGAAKAKGRAATADITGIPGVWMDLDLRDAAAHKQSDLPETLEEIQGKLPLEPTVVVHSGHGVHLHWLFREVWVFDGPEDKKRAEGLLQGFQRYVRQRMGYKLDATHDLARVLRLPGTVNYKDKAAPKQVCVIAHSGIRYSYDDLDQYTVEAESVETPAMHAGFKRLPTDGPAANLLEHCAFIRHCRDNAATLPEPWWVAMLSNVARCSDGVQVAHELSAPYTGYSPAETDVKIAHVLSEMHPTTCQYIKKTLGFQGCPSGGCSVKAPCAFALEKRFRKPTKELRTDLGNAERLIRMFGDRIKYCHQIGFWLIWDGMRYKIDDQGQIMRYAKATVRSFFNDAAKEPDGEERKKIIAFAMKSEGLARVKAMIEAAQHMAAVHVDELDQEKWLLNVKNGVLDLRTGWLYPHDNRGNITKLAPVEYDPNAKCERFMKFMNDVFDGNQAIIEFMQRFLGYCLTGDTSEQKMGIAYGARGSNGKSTLLGVFSDMLGDYADTTPTETLMAKKSEGIPNDIARLRGARFVLASETKENRKLDEALVKQVTGQDRLTARFLRQEFFTFIPGFKIMLVTNHKPRINGDDDALGRRLLLIPFTQRFEGQKKDKKLPEKLRQEFPGILAWCVKGCLEWQKKGLCPPEEVLEATEEYKEENDAVNNWMEECCNVGENLVEASVNLYESYRNWCARNGERYCLTQNKLTSKLTEKGFLRCKPGDVRSLRGLALQGVELARIRFNSSSF